MSPNIPVPSISGVEGNVSCFFERLLGSVRARLAVCASMALKDRRRPLCLLLETKSGYGKTTALEMFLPTDQQDKMNQYIYRSDKFTPRSFVSHAANQSKERLAQTDLLPKLGDKIFVTKELAPLFRGREQELADTFGMLISVLDGMGFVSDSGMQGRRGYQEKILFNWLGATTPLTAEVHRLMAQLGTRLLFYEVPAVFPSEDELAEYATGDLGVLAIDACQYAVHEFLKEFFELHPVKSVPNEDIRISERGVKTIARWARFLAQVRAEVKCEKLNNDWTPIAAQTPENPMKIVDYFKDLARGNALVEARDEVNDTDLDLVSEVATSSTPGHLRPIMRLLRSSGQADASKCEAACQVSRKTARRSMEELRLLKVCSIKKGSPQTNEPDVACLTPALEWLKSTCRQT